MNLIEQVLKLDAEWKAAVRAYEISGRISDDLAADLAREDLKDIGPTAAPKLARALKVAIEELARIERENEPPGIIGVNAALAEIEKELE